MSQRFVAGEHCHTRLVWRPTLKPAQGLALGVRNVGRGVLYPGFRYAGVKPCG